MIKSFKCKETEKLFHGRFSVKLPQAIQRTAAIKLTMLNAATVLETLLDSTFQLSGGVTWRQGRSAQHPNQQTVAHLLYVAR
jgi:hypothetical protein